MRSRTTCFALLLAAIAPLAAGPALATEASKMETTIQQALVEKLGDDAKTIRVAFYDGKALLSGKVSAQSTQELAREVALWVPGVTKVENEIEPTDEKAFGTGKILAESGDAALETAVKDALKKEIGTHAGAVEVEACQGMVSLRGTLPDKARHELAMAAATKVADVKKVVDLLRVAG